MDYRIEQFVTRLESNLAKSPDVSKTANEFGLSVSRLRHLFKEIKSESINNYLKRKRLEKAAELLRYTELRIKVIGAEVGMFDKNSFLRAFKKQFGKSPLEYRKNFRISQIDRQTAESDDK